MGTSQYSSLLSGLSGGLSSWRIKIMLCKLRTETWSFSEKRHVIHSNHPEKNPSFKIIVVSDIVCSYGTQSMLEVDVDGCIHVIIMSSTKKSYLAADKTRSGFVARTQQQVYVNLNYTDFIAPGENHWTYLIDYWVDFDVFIFTLNTQLLCVLIVNIIKHEY